MTNNCASEGDVAFDATQGKFQEEKDYLMALSLWRTDTRAAAVRARKLRRRNFSRRDGPRLSLSSSKKKSFKQPRTSKLSSEEWKKRYALARHALSESRVARDFQHQVSKTNYILTPFVPFVKSLLEREAIVRASRLGGVWRRYRRDKRSTRRAPSRVIIEDRDYEDVLEQLRVNAGFYDERSSDPIATTATTTTTTTTTTTASEVSEIDELNELLDSDDVVVEDEEEEIEPVIGRMAPTVWGSDGVSVYLK